MNAGQMCWAGSRLLVHEDVHDQLVEAVVAEVAKWKVGPGLEEGVRIGSLVHETHRQEVLRKNCLMDWHKVVMSFVEEKP